MDAPTTRRSRCNGPQVWKQYGLQPWYRHCRKCHQRLKAITIEKNRKRYAAQRSRRWREEPVYRATLMWRGARTRARREGLEFNIELSRIINAFLKGYCEATGIRFDLAAYVKRGFNPFSPSVDRIDSTQGYTSDNVQIVCWIYNRAKGAGSHADVVKMAEALARKIYEGAQ